MRISPTLEQLEDRCCPTAPIPAPQINVIIAGNWSPSQVAQLETMLQAVTGPQYQPWAVYGEGPAHLGTIDVVPSAHGYPAAPKLSRSEIKAGRLPSPSPDQLYVVFPEPGVSGGTLHAQSHRLKYAVIPGDGVDLTNPQGEGVRSQAYTHELDEAIVGKEVVDPVPVSDSFFLSGYVVSALLGPQGQIVT